MTQMWTVRGTLAVDETWTTCGEDGALVVRRRPLAGVRVEVRGFPDDRACRSPFGSAVTDSAGRFRVRAVRPTWSQELDVRARFADALVVVGVGGGFGARELAPWRELVAEAPATGPVVELGTLVFGHGEPGARGRHADEAAAWYVARTALAFLRARGEATPITPLVLASPVKPSRDAVLHDVVRWWLHGHADPDVPAGLVVSSVQRALWPTQERVTRLTAAAELPCTRGDDCVGGPVPHTEEECLAMEARWNAGRRRRTG
ncbi:hypothetical protein J421_4974 (plasmid) [Gemmatirosa kalamazoonensis]|uniref:Uncharacterized protein n=1 Tax=Gemmatirosa kalamazoonensis TaxID=861299 RepID=W0RNA1_9BACT|nr:hypothetical protein [Gemmatirosa kalamazoonensis]AHG92509.1 hypothetical protein J421_4974 [Gemmatirosa kalamazoonensis]